MTETSLRSTAAIQVAITSINKNIATLTSLTISTVVLPPTVHVQSFEQTMIRFEEMVDSICGKSEVAPSPSRQQISLKSLTTPTSPLIDPSYFVDFGWGGLDGAASDWFDE
ncbi:hypothetical protein LINGRAHAP2_LOCUS14412 [Linum grandiflorum]